MDYDGATMDKINMEFLHVDKETCDIITITSPEQVHIKNNDTDGSFADFSLDCVLTVLDQGSEEIIEYVRVDTQDENGISKREERKLRKENKFVRELYEQYKVALILAHKGGD